MSRGPSSRSAGDPPNANGSTDHSPGFYSDSDHDPTDDDFGTTTGSYSKTGFGAKRGSSPGLGPTDANPTYDTWGVKDEL